MRRIGQWLNPVGFVLVGLCALLPFVTVRSASPQVISGSYAWTGVDLVVGGNMREGLIDLHNGSPDPITVGEMYGDDYAGEVRFMPGHVAGIVAALMVLTGAMSSLLAGRRMPIAVATVAALAATAAMSVAQSQALQHVLLAWSADLGRHRAPVYTHAFDPVVTTGYGFWVCLGLVLALGVANAALAGKKVA
jgi:hypothetical protein